MTDRTCSIDGCDGDPIARGWCQKHYGRWYNQGDPEKLVGRGRRPSKPVKLCSIEGCGHPMDSRGWCGMHLRRWYKWGTTDLPERAKMRECNQCRQRFPLDSFTGTARV